ncbi:hypothetical protein M758_4G081000 [Ceratodon purpureus]|uniref:Uncharacterized protein n=1 Tax=Ceratodon purpureus TaxID=3225 RepID=A0A8T0I696_CERPU|nr:hypothetical protein KC19_4G080200 [Ceratodon purpureus]KAG0618643.1 hypothetical protein M758_4G081000 [Ceratodon purpureus]
MVPPFHYHSKCKFRVLSHQNSSLNVELMQPLQVAILLNKCRYPPSIDPTNKTELLYIDRGFCTYPSSARAHTHIYKSDNVFLLYTSCGNGFLSKRHPNCALHV